MPAEDETLDDCLVIGITLRFLTTEEGGRSMPLGMPSGEYTKFQYRPNWGLPGMVGTDQVGAPVLWFGHFPVALGDTVRAVILPFAPGSLRLFRAVRPGDELRMFEGSRVCGRGTVEWVRGTHRPVQDSDQDRFVGWVEGGDLSG
jgi:hypothetical protein